MTRRLAVVLAVMVTAGLLALPAVAAKPASSIRLAGAAPSYGQTVTFNVSASVTTDPFVHVRCVQGATLVYESWQAASPYPFTLSSEAWPAGAADCVAHLENWDRYGLHGKIVTLASATFHVGA